MDFPGDKKVLNIGDQYMFGPSIMVCPVYHYKARSREVYLPAGQGWYDFYTGQFFEGGQIITANAPFERIPLFVKEGSIIPVGPEVEYALQSKNDDITLLIYQGADAVFDLYEDENVNYNYEKGDFGLLTFSYSENDQRLKIERQQGKFEGMPESRKIEITAIGKNNRVGFSNIDFAIEKVNYQGEELVIPLDEK